MSKSYQRCRNCGVEIPSGYTDCDTCHLKFNNLIVPKKPGGPVKPTKPQRMQN